MCIHTPKPPAPPQAIPPIADQTGFVSDQQSSLRRRRAAAYGLQSTILTGALRNNNRGGSTLGT